MERTRISNTSPAAPQGFSAEDTHKAHIKQSTLVYQYSQNLQKSVLKDKNHNVPESLKKENVLSMLDRMNSPEEALELCIRLEEAVATPAFASTSPEVNLDEIYQKGIEKFGNSSLYMEATGFFYYKNGKFHKALASLNKAQSLEKTYFSLTLGMASAYGAGQYHLVLDYFKKLSAKEASELDEEMVTKIATSALHQGEFTLATKMFEGIRAKLQAKPLPKLEETLMEKFHSPDELKSWSKKVSMQMQKPGERSVLSLADCITYAGTLMHENRFDEALNCLTTIKTERFE